MATVEHSTLTSGNLHEPKGADSALINQSYVANGAGSGVWEKVIGFGQYQDDRRTAVSPAQTLSSGVRTKFLCNGAFLTEEYLPSDATGPLWNVSTNTHEPIKAFDTYDFRVSFTADNFAGTSPFITVELDIGAPIGVILSQTTPLLRLGSDQKVVFTSPVFTGSTYLANGGEFYLTYDGTGTVDIHSNSIMIKRTGRNT